MKIPLIDKIEELFETGKLNESSYYCSDWCTIWYYSEGDQRLEIRLYYSWFSSPTVSRTRKILEESEVYVPLTFSEKRRLKKILKSKLKEYKIKIKSDEEKKAKFLKDKKESLRWWP